MPPVDSFPDGALESLARISGDFGTGSMIDRALLSKGLRDGSGESTKWKRLNWAFGDLQYKDKCANGVLDLVSDLLKRDRFVGRNDEFERHRESLNELLVLHGIEYGADGEFRNVKSANTLSEAEQRVRVVGEKLRGRRIHTEVSKYCRAELMQENYFHAVFEAVKGLAERIRDMSEMDGDGTRLVDDVFSGDSPALAINYLETEADKQQQRGFAALLRACFAAIRNEIAHEPKVFWQGEDDVADYFTLISLAHFKLDNCVPTRPRGSRRT